MRLTSEPGHGIFFHGGGSLQYKPKFRKGVSMFLGEFLDIIAFLLPNIFGKHRMGVCHPGGGLSKRGVRPSNRGVASPIHPPPLPGYDTPKMVRMFGVELNIKESLHYVAI